MLEQLLEVHEQQLDVEQLEQLEQLVLELHQPAASYDRSGMSSISKVLLSRVRSSFCRSSMGMSSWGWDLGRWAAVRPVVVGRRGGRHDGQLRVATPGP